MVYGWRTTKTNEGFTWEVYSTGYQIPTVVLRTGTAPTRERATAAAKRNVMPYRRGQVQ